MFNVSKSPNVSAELQSSSGESEKYNLQKARFL